MTIGKLKKSSFKSKLMCCYKWRRISTHTIHHPRLCSPLSLLPSDSEFSYIILDSYSELLGKESINIGTISPQHHKIRSFQSFLPQAEISKFKICYCRKNASIPLWGCNILKIWITFPFCYMYKMFRSLFLKEGGQGNETC